MAHLSTAAFGDLVGRIYDCAVDASRWPGALDALRQALGCEIAILALHDLQHGRVLLDETVNVADPWQERRATFHEDAVALWGGIGVIRSHPADEPAALSRVRGPSHSTAPNPWAVHWAEPQGLVDHLALVLARDDGGFGCVGFGRHRGVGMLSDRDIARARLFVPHLQRAATIGRLLDMQRSLATDLATVLDGLAQPVLLLDEHGAICYRNAASLPLFEPGGLFSDIAGTVSSPIASIALALRRVVHACARTGLPPGRGFGIPVRDEAGGMHALHVLPLGDADVRRPLVRKAVAALFVASPSAPRDATPDLVGGSYGLTPTETRVFARLAAGQTTQEAATALGISASTFKTHLLRVFAKLGVHRQVELVRLAASVASPTRSARPAIGGE